MYTYEPRSQDWLAQDVEWKGQWDRWISGEPWIWTLPLLHQYTLVVAGAKSRLPFSKVRLLWWAQHLSIFTPTKNNGVWPTHKSVSWFIHINPGFFRFVTTHFDASPSPVSGGFNKYRVALRCVQDFLMWRSCSKLKLKSVFCATWGLGCPNMGITGIMPPYNVALFLLGNEDDAHQISGENLSRFCQTLWIPIKHGMLGIGMLGRDAGEAQS